MTRITLLTALILVCGFGSQTHAQDTPFDILILNGRIMDGTGNPWFYGDVAIRGDEIVQIGAIGQRKAKQVIDAKGHIVSPGFIDIHSHADDTYGNDNIRSDDPVRHT